MKITLKITNYNQKPMVNNNQSFGNAQIVLNDKDLFWQSATDSGYKEKYAKPFIKWFNNFLKDAEMQKAIDDASDKVVIKPKVSRVSPEQFIIKVFNEDSYEKEHPVNYTLKGRNLRKQFKKELVKSIREAAV